MIDEKRTGKGVKRSVISIGGKGISRRRRKRRRRRRREDEGSSLLLLVLD